MSSVEAKKDPQRTPRLAASVKIWQKMFLRQRDGDSCKICGVDGKDVRLEIDHVNGDPRDDSPENLRLLCHRCNVNEYWRHFNAMLTAQSTQTIDSTKGCPQAENVSGSEREKTPPILMQSQMDGRSGECERENALPVWDESLELRINREKEPLFRRKVLDLALSRPQCLTVHDALYEVTERVGISPITGRRYLDKMISRAGPLRLGQGRRGHEPLLPRESYWKRGQEQSDGKC